MPDWRDIPDTEIDGDSPLLASTMTSLRDNVEALAENATGSPDFPASSLVKNSGVIRAYQSRLAAGNLGNIGGGYYEFLDVSFDNTFSETIKISIDISWLFEPDTEGEPDLVRVKVDGTVIDSAFDPREYQGSFFVETTVTTGTHNITFESSGGPINGFTGFVRVIGSWI